MNLKKDATKLVTLGWVLLVTKISVYKATLHIIAKPGSTAL